MPTVPLHPLQIAVIGAGLIGREHAARIIRNPRAQLAAVVDPAPGAAERAAGNGVPCYENVESMLAAQRPDGAIVATPTDSHAATAITLLDAGIPVLVEKPLADTVEAGCALVEAAQRAGVPALCGYHRRHSPAIQAARACVAAGTLGRIVAVTATTLFYKPEGYFDVAWRVSPAGGPVLINQAHDIDSLRLLVGEIAAVQAAGSSGVRGLGVEDTAAAILEFENGALGTLIVSDCTVAPRSWEQTSGENPLYARDAGQDSIFLAGTLGSLSVPTMQSWRQTGPASWALPFITERLPLTAADPLVRQMDHFCDVIERRAEPLVPVADALRSLAATLAVREAIARRMRIVPAGTLG